MREHRRGRHVRRDPSMRETDRGQFDRRVDGAETEDIPDVFTPLIGAPIREFV